MTLVDRRTRLLLLLGVGLVAVGLWAWLSRGDGRRPDPERTAPLGTVAPTDPPPGDPDRVRLEGFDEVAITVEPADGGDLLTWCVLAALEAEQRARGLMEVTDLQGYSGMVFVYDEDVSNGFYMRNTPTPLSIAWVAADGEVVTIEDMAPCEDRDDCPTYSPDGDYRYAIEAFQGDLADLGITEDARVAVGGTCAPTTSD